MEINVDRDILLKFIWKAHQNTYYAPREISITHRSGNSILPGFVDYVFVEGDWQYHDSYAGRKWPPGKEVIFFRNVPVWCMSYQGKVSDHLDEKKVDSVYLFLKKALRNAQETVPFRGPGKFLEGDYEYSFEFNGDYSYFVGRESVKQKGVEVFFQDVMGSLIK